MVCGMVEGGVAAGKRVRCASHRLTACAFTTLDQVDDKLSAALSRAALLRMGEVNAQDIAR